MEILLFYGVFFGVIGFGVYLFGQLISWSRNPRSTTSPGSSKYSSQSQFTMGAFLNYLKDMKLEGNKTIDEIIEDITQKIGSDNVVVNDKEKLETEIPEFIAMKHQEVSEPKKSMDTSNLLLYLGAFIFSVAIFVFAAFTWNMYSAGFKMTLTLLVPVAFFVAGWYFNKLPKYATAASTFILVGSLSLGFAGLGLWNFGGLAQTGISFSSYWLAYSSVLILAYLAIWTLLKQQRYLYLFLFAVYSAIASFATTFSNIAEVRILFMMFLNVLFYVLTLQWDSASDFIRKVPKVIAKVLDVVGVLVVFSVIGHVSEASQFACALIIIVPFFVDLAQAYFKNAEKEEKYAVLSLVPRIFILLLVYTASPVFTFIVLAWTVMTVSIFAEIRYQKTNPFYNVLLLWNRILTIGIALSLIPSGSLPGYWSDGSGALIPFGARILSATLLSIALSLPVLVGNSTVGLGITLLPLLLTITATKYSFSSTAIVLTSISGIFLIARMFVTNSQEKIGRHLLSIGEVLLLIAAWFSLTSTTLATSLQLYLTGALWPILLGVKGQKRAILFGIPFVLMATISITEHFNAGSMSNWSSLCYLIPVIGYTMFSFVPKLSEEQKKYTVVSAFFFGVLAMMVTLFIVEIAIVVQLFFAFCMLVLMFTTENHVLGYLSGIALSFWMFTLAKSFDLTEGATLLLTGSILMFMQLLLSVIESIEGISELLKKGMHAFGITFFWTAIFVYIRSLSVLGVTASESGSVSFLPIVFQTAFGLTFASIGIILSPVSSRLKRVSGIGLVLASWLFSTYYEASSLWFTLPITIYLGVLAFISYRDNQLEETSLFELLAVVIQGLSLLTLSSAGSEASQLSYGLLLISLSLATIFAGNIWNRKILYYGGIIFLTLELLIRIWFIIVLIPWWVYLAIIGLALMGAGIAAVSKKD